MTLDFEEGNFQVTADRLAHGTRPHQRLFFLSAVGTSTEVRAFRAALGMDAKRTVLFRWRPAGTRGGAEVLPRDKGEEYEVRVAPIGPHVYHLLAVSRNPAFLADVRPRAVFSRLAKLTTTPIHPSWADWLTNKLREEQLLQDVVAYGGDLRPGLLLANDETLDQIVSGGLAARQLTVPV